MATKLNIFWFRRDLRLSDNVALFHALEEEGKVMPIFIFDEDILEELPEDDARVSFIYQELKKINARLEEIGSKLSVYHGKVDEVFNVILQREEIDGLFFNEDYEPYAVRRDAGIRKKFLDHQLNVQSFKDQVIFAKDDVLKTDGTPYTVYTPFMKKWRSKFESQDNKPWTVKLTKDGFIQKTDDDFPTLSKLGFVQSTIKVKPFDITRETIITYGDNRNFPAKASTSLISPHLRFGTIGIRELMERVLMADPNGGTYLNELIWREFFMQILYHFPESQTMCFKRKYEHVKWRNNEEEFDKWCNGETGYLMVDAGMNQLNKSGYMHNRVRMVVASFLCKHLLIDWRWGEAYFSKKLLDYESASNVGNWQWAAGCGCDAAPYFRIFNPHTQLKKFDPEADYVTNWLGEIDMRTFQYPEIVEHKFARNRALEAYKKGLENR